MATKKAPKKGAMMDKEDMKEMKAMGTKAYAKQERAEAKAAEKMGGAKKKSAKGPKKM